MAGDGGAGDGGALRPPPTPPLPPALLETAAVVAEVMRGARDPWCVIGSAAIAFHGIDPGPVGDVDVVASERDARRFADLMCIPLAPGKPHERFRSAVFGWVERTPLAIEIMAGFEVTSPAGWKPVLPCPSGTIELPQRPLYVPSLVDLAAMLRAFGRPQDRRRAALLEARMRQARVQET